MALTLEQKKKLLDRFLLVSNKVKLGTLIDEIIDTLEGGVADDAVSTAKLQDDAVTTDKIEDGAVSLAKLATAIAPSHVVKFAGKFTTVGGDAAETISAAGVIATDIVLVNVQTLGTGSRSIVAAIPGTDEIDVTMSGDPTNDHILSYIVLRAA